MYGRIPPNQLAALGTAVGAAVPAGRFTVGDVLADVRDDYFDTLAALAAEFSYPEPVTAAALGAYGDGEELEFQVTQYLHAVVASAPGPVALAVEDHGARLRIVSADQHAA